MTKFTKILVLSLVIGLISCQPACKQVSDAERKAIEKTIETSADSLAAAISRLDADGVTNLFSKIDGTLYIADGSFIPRTKIKETFQNIFEGLQEMSFTFENKEVCVLNPDVAVLTGWAHSIAVTKTGRKMDEKAIFANIYVRADKTWSIFQSQKSPVLSYPQSETSKARPRLSKFCQGNGIDLGYGGDPIVPTVITMDLPRPYARLGDHPQNLAGDARDLYWFRNNILDYVYSSHLLEDFSSKETAAVLREWLRVIKVGGVLVLYGPDEQAYRAHCKKTGQDYNPSHKIDDFGLRYVKRVLEQNFQGTYSIVHEIELIDDYCFDLVVRKLK
jgi:uncharacterized protein (TIGR02246 family)